MRSGPPALLLLSTLFVSCAQRAAPRVAGDGEFVLELGGAGRSLAGSLTGMGVRLLPAPDPLTAAVADPEPAAREPERRTPESPDTPKQDPTKVPEGPVEEPSWFEVQLGPQETLMDVASKHLGSAKRFKEIMTLNGWTDRDARRLKAGTRIKVPKPASSGATK